ncbi:hypothetical protein [Spirosoma areae]
METDYFSLRLNTLTADLNIPDAILESATEAARQAFEEQRRAGAAVNLAIEHAEAVMLETITPTLDAASRLKDILTTDFAHVPALASPPHFGKLVQQFMPLLTDPPSRLADAYIVGLLTEYLDKHFS